MYDVIVVGARCAGASTAMLLGRKGYRVLLVDRARFPSDSPNGNCVLYPGVAQLKRWGLLDRVLASNCPPIRRWTSDLGDFALSGEVTTSDCLPSAIGPRRVVLDKILVDAAVEAGVELREGFGMSDMVTDGGRIAGIRGSARGGATVTERARIVIGADGRHSRVARLVGAATYQERAPLACYYYAFWAGVPVKGLEMYWQPRRIVFVFPTNDGLTGIFVGLPHEQFHAFRSDIEGNYMRAIEMMPALDER
ncbi:MAG: NAD(P)/FAD-dependent oxidoreductase, partial [Chloroflexota bacterium]|nr:NAD(P)/FAD-dependent oxidoreductase [Chloroflexota bacterium]